MAEACRGDSLPLPAVVSVSPRADRNWASNLANFLKTLAEATKPSLCSHRRRDPAADALLLSPARTPAMHWAVSALGGERLRVRDSVWASDELSGALKAVCSLPYFGVNQTSHKFYSGTLGFHITFRDTYRQHVEEHLPCLKHIFAHTLRSECNCFFVNVFYARPDGQAYHVDNKFTDYCGKFRETDIVTVAYLSVSDTMLGGDLVVLNVSKSEVGRPLLEVERGREHPGEILQRIRPKTGRVVDFDGRLLHAVCAFESEQPRVSLVIEQCRLPRRHFLNTPKFNIFSQKTNEDLILA